MFFFEDLVSSFARDGNWGIEDSLEKKDHCFAYRYMTGTISNISRLLSRLLCNSVTS
ncbi:hypothetical protein NEOC65_000824 [Neochlamydia sp. AcF65]|nr:hypothetical protein [Neochlamydia sp. AcF65]